MDKPNLHQNLKLLSVGLGDIKPRFRRYGLGVISFLTWKKAQTFISFHGARGNSRMVLFYIYILTDINLFQVGFSRA